MATAVLALGSNIAPAKENLDRAVEALRGIGTVEQVAPYILSAPYFTTIKYSLKTMINTRFLFRTRGCRNGNLY